MNITVDSITNPGNCGHRTLTVTVNGQQRTVTIHTKEVQEALPDDTQDFKDAFILVLRHQYKSRIAAGRTPTQALNDLVGFTVRI